MNEQLLADNIAKLLERVRLSAEKSQRCPDDILLLAVSKTRSSADIRAAHACGLDQFGESYLQEALIKIGELDDLKIARRLSEQRPGHLPPLQVCLQLNISGEPSKSGVAPEQLQEFAEGVAALPRLQLRGLMAIPAPSPDRAEQRQAFASVRQAFEQLRENMPQLDTLSMGMSADLEAAVAEGATILRPGTAIFGPRDR
jgi:uncharacterized pyridoxal phosphate-containing UPF0001 family protein